MLILQNLSLQASRKSFMNSTQKYIKITINQHLAATKQPAIVKSASLLEWTQIISLPLFLNSEYFFQIYDKHQFGYSPQELSRIVGGKIIVGDNDTFNNWQVLNDKKQKFGYLSASIRKRIKYDPHVAAVIPQMQMMSVTSISARISTLKEKRGYVILRVGQKKTKTQIVKSRGGELLFTQLLQIEKVDQIEQAIVEAYSYDAREDKSALLGTGVLKFDSNSIQKKITIANEKGLEVGEVVIDYRISPKQAYLASKQMANVVRRSSLSKSIDVDRLGWSQNMSLGLSQVGRSHDPMSASRRRSFTRLSMVNANKNIFMPTQKRFVSYIDKQNQRISYLNERHDFDFKQKHSKNYYKGASIGVGDKSDFTHLVKDNPGVGVYNLPSIWDRY